MKKFLVIIIGFVLLSLPAKAGSFSLPSDMPTVEALINFHKILASWEDASMKQVAVSKVAQDTVTGKTNKFYQVRDMLNSKMEVGYQWVTLASLVSRLTLSTANLLKDYKDFQQTFAKSVKKEPIVILNYATTNYNLYNKITLLEKSLATVFASETGIFKADMKERMEMLMVLDGQVDELRTIVKDATWWIYCMSTDDYRIDYIWEILNNEVLNKIAQDLCVKWTTNNSKFNTEGVSIPNI